MTSETTATKSCRPARYIFFVTGNEPWIDVAVNLHQRKIATPILWLGDDKHYQRARSIFDTATVKMLDFVHRPFDIPLVNYQGELNTFFHSKDYLDCKDICLKMMDRLDLNGCFSRIDREAYFHKLLIWALKFFYDEKPDALVAIEKPHSHAQYLIYRIARYQKIRVVNFKDCSLLPVNFLQWPDGSFVEKKHNSNAILSKRFSEEISLYVRKITSVAEKGSPYAPEYIKVQQRNVRLVHRLTTFFRSDWLLLLKDFLSDIKLIFGSNYQAVNPFKFLFFRRLMIKQTRKKNLYQQSQQSDDVFDITEKFLYFPLHFEPERTTNPDGENFHDQFKALAALKSSLPEDVTILVKEHPSQFLMSDRGSRGRSPLFYNLIKNIKNLKIVNKDTDSLELIRNCWATATITGSVAIESALIGKPAIVFGQPWFIGCPNTYKFDEWMNLDLSRPFATEPRDKVELFLKQLIQNFGIPMVNNGGQIKYFSERWYDSEFVKIQHKEMIALLEQFFTVNGLLQHVDAEYFE